jgi:hypothetical protein
LQLGEFRLVNLGYFKKTPCLLPTLPKVEIKFIF